MMVLKKCPNEGFKEVFEFYANFFRQLKEPHINREVKASLDEVDDIDENKLNQNFIQWTSNMDQRGFKIDHDHANHAKYLFKDLLNNKQKIEKFAKVCNNQKLRNHIGYLCVRKFNQICGKESTDEEFLHIYNIAAEFYKFKFFSNNSLRRMILKLGHRKTTINFCTTFVPLVKSSNDPYFKEYRDLIMLADKFTDDW
jgi:hypothetical protein